MPGKISFMILFFFAFLLAAGDAPYQKVASHGMDVYYREFGEGSPILVLGGGPGDVSNRYLSLCEGLAKSQRCILVDQRGTGKSMPAVLDASTVSIALTLEDLEAIRRSLGLKQWAVLGFSYGGYLASLYAHFYPGSVSRLILLGSMGLNTDAFPHFMDNIASRLRPSDIELFDYWNDPARAAANPKHALVERIRARMPGYFFDRKKSLLVSQAMKDSDFDFEMGDFIWQDMDKRKLDLAKMAADFANPVLILHGRQDPLGESVPQELAKYYKNSELGFIEKCGHYSWIEQPEKVFPAVKDFLAGRKD
jgi:proline iminopeptidase